MCYQRVFALKTKSLLAAQSQKYTIVFPISITKMQAKGAFSKVPLPKRQVVIRPQSLPKMMTIVSEFSDSSDSLAKVSSSRRANLLSSVGLVVGASICLPRAADAAYGDSARVFGEKTKTSDFTQFVEDEFSVDIPAKWNPDGSKINGSKLR